jgi:predicted helicase
MDSKEFSDIYIIDLGGDIRANPKLSGTTHNVFGIQAGVAISFMVKKSNIKDKVPCKIHYYRRPEFETAEEKIKFLSATNLFNIEFIDSIIKNSEWINIAENNFDDLLPIISKETKSLTPNENQKTVFRVFAMGSATNRDEWVYDFSEENLKQKMISRRSIISSIN